MANPPDRSAIIACLIDLLKKERQKQKLSLNEVARRAGLSHAMISRMEKRERTPTIDTLLRVAEALNIDLSTFLKRAIQTTKKN